jgi:phosphatidylserine/phosphatidylglycerophosphate/cardiolipin synthase-like enzyme/peptidoglycan hydrolase-like protein with peptidoglycan-binding domain
MESPFTDFAGTIPARINREQAVYEELEIKSPFIEVDLNSLLQEPEVKVSRQITASPVKTVSRWKQIIQNTVQCQALPLLQGKETFIHMVDAIRTAVDSTHYIYILGWMIDLDFQMIAGDPNSTMGRLLETASSKGVEIRIMIWDNPVYIEKIREAATRIGKLSNATFIKDNATFGSTAVKNAISTVRFLFSQIHYPFSSLDSIKNLKDKLNSIQNEGSHHEKVVVVKGNTGLIGFCGGIDINENRLKGTDAIGRSEVLHDVHCELKGHAAWVLLHRFIWRWQVYWSEKMPVAKPVMDLLLKGEKEPIPVSVPVTANTANVKILQTYNHPSNPSVKDRSIRETVKLAIMNAKKTIHIEDQYMISLEIASWLNKKLLSEPGFQKVSILTQHDIIAKDDLLFPKSMRKKFIDILQNGLSASDIKNKISIQILDPNFPPSTHHKVHSKIYIIDDELAIIGSANLSSRSMTHDSETDAVIFSDPGSSVNFAASLRLKESRDPDLSIIPYAPSTAVKDLDEEIVDEVKDPPTAIKVLLGAASSFLPDFVSLVVDKLKPAIIDIIDPDADNTQPQQELEMPFSVGEWESPFLTETYPGKTDNLNEEESETAKPTVKTCVTRTCWAKTVLNRNLGLTLPEVNTLDEDFKKALRDFQQKNNLPQSGKIDSATERALMEADAQFKVKGTVAAPAVMATIAVAKTKIEDWTTRSVNNKPKYILDSYRDPRKIFAFVLHHMAFKRKNRQSGKYSDPNSYLSTGAHFCILFDGKIIQLHPLSRMIWHGNCVSPGSVAVEFEGNFPNIKGKWWVEKDAKFPDKDKPTQQQYDSGRFLANYLKIVLGIREILAHRQSSDSRENDPGPDIWYNVGQWAVDNLGLSDGGPGFKCGTGNPILPEWRTWGKTVVPAKSSELEESNMMYEGDHDESEFGNQYEGSLDEDSEWRGDEAEYEEEDWSNAVSKNRYYADKIGWDKYNQKINDLLLPFSGLSNVSLGEEAFAQAVAAWQNSNGFTGKNADGIIGPSTWSAMSRVLNVSVPQEAVVPVASAGNVFQLINGVQVRFAKKPRGWAAYGGGDLKKRLQELKQKGLLNLGDNDIEMFRLVSISESGGLVNAINSWDSAYMSMGFMQFTIQHYKLQEVIKKAPASFKKFDIELDNSRAYLRDPKIIAIKNAADIEDLRSFEWAVRFFRAGLEDEAIVAQIEVGLVILNDLRKRFDQTGYLNRYNNLYPNLWAFIYEANNSRPAILNIALKMAVDNGRSKDLDDARQFGLILVTELKNATGNFYNNPRIKFKTDEARKERVNEELAKVGRIIKNTGM